MSCPSNDPLYRKPYPTGLSGPCRDDFHQPGRGSAKAVDAQRDSGATPRQPPSDPASTSANPDSFPGVGAAAPDTPAGAAPSCQTCGSRNPATVPPNIAACADPFHSPPDRIPVEYPTDELQALAAFTTPGVSCDYDALNRAFERAGKAWRIEAGSGGRL